MGVIEKLKKLHKQTMLKLADIRSTEIVDVDFDKYLSRARTLKSYISPSVINLDRNSQTADNVLLLNDNLGISVDKINLIGSFVGDGGVYTLCLPFDLTCQDIEDKFKNSYFYEFNSLQSDNGSSVVFLFTQVKYAIAGVPYIVEPIKGTTIKDIVFENKTIKAALPLEIKKSYIYNEERYVGSVVGIFNPTDITGDPAVRFVDASGKTISKPAADGTKLKGLRAYFKLPPTINTGTVTYIKNDIKM